VDDDCDTVPVRRDANDEGGRGLIIVDTMSTTWGTYANRRDKIVWCELQQ
jgi:hypothetical protein